MARIFEPAFLPTNRNVLEYCGNCKKYIPNGGKCTGARSRHCKKYKKVEENDEVN